MTIPFYTLDRLRAIKEFVVFLGIPVLLIITIHANSIAAKNAGTTGELVKSQGVVLQAIKNATDDNRLTAEQKSNLIICLALVPQDERTADTAVNCRKQADATSVVSNDGSASKTGSSSVGTTSPSPKPTSTSATTQPNNSQTSQSGTTPTPKPSTLQRVLNFINPHK